MRFDVVIGNPPYHEADSGHGISAAPIYQHFFRQAIALRPKSICMIIPSRWFAGGKGLAEFRTQMLRDKRLHVIDDFPDSSSVFPKVQIKGGVCIVARRERLAEKLRVISNLDLRNPIIFDRDYTSRDLDVFIRFHKGLSVLEKVSKISGEPHPMAQTMESMVSVRRPFGFGAEERGEDGQFEGPTLVLHHKGGRSRILRTRVLSGTHLVESWKIFLPRLASGSDRLPHPVLGNAFIGGPGSICTETYLTVGPFNSPEEAENALSYLNTRFFRYLCLLRKSSQDTPRSVFRFVPLQDFSRAWDDDSLYRLYEITRAEENEIQSLVSLTS